MGPARTGKTGLDPEANTIYAGATSKRGIRLG